MPGNICCPSFSFKRRCVHFVLLFCSVFGGFLPGAVFAAKTSIIGRWIVRDDRTGKVAAHLRIVKNAKAGHYYGFLTKAFDAATGRPVKYCQGCVKKYQKTPISGFPLVRQVKFGSGKCSKGEILDPRSDTWYKITCHLVKGGKQLRVRGYVLIPLFGKTVTFYRLR